jgi:tetratricopeptide (TPR) repeat protein
VGTPTDQYLRLVVSFDRQLKKARREGRLSRPVDVRFLAYSDVAAPPSRALPADFDYQTCAATFYPISRCLVHEFDAAKCSRNVEKQQCLHGWLRDPDRHYRGQVEIGEYYNVSRYKSLPLCLMHSMAHDIPYYYAAGARYFQYMHVTTGRWGNKSLTNYQMARQTWDVKTDCESLWADFLARRYGPAAEVMRQFYESLEKMLDNVEPLKGWSSNLASRLQSGAEKLFVEPHLQYRREEGVPCDAPTLVEMLEHGQKCRTLIDRALAMQLPERIASRISEDERMFTYGERTLAYYNACVRAFALGRAGKMDEARRHYDEAKRLADLLRDDTWSVGLSFVHDEPFPLDAFHATYADQALNHLKQLLRLSDNDK